VMWANQLNLTGFSLVGKPGIVCVEGFLEKLSVSINKFVVCLGKK